MKNNYVPSDLTYSKEEIGEINREVDALVETFLPTVEDVLQTALVRQTVETASDEIVDEALASLTPLLAGPVSQDLDAESSKLRQQIAADLKRSLEAPKPDDEWFQNKAGELARATATYWFSLGADHSERFASAMTALNDLIHESSASTAAQHFGVLCQGFGLNRFEQGTLLAGISARARRLRWQRILLEMEEHQEQRREERPSILAHWASLAIEFFNPSKMPRPAEPPSPTAFTAVYCKSRSGYFGFIEELPGVNSHGRTLDEAKRTLMRLSSGVFEHDESQWPITPPLERHLVRTLAMKVMGSAGAAGSQQDEVEREQVRWSY